MLRSPSMQPGNDTRPPAAPKLTYNDFLSFPDDGQRHELIDAEHFVTPSSATVHQRLVGALHLALGNVLKATRLGEVFVAPFDVVLSDHDVVEPDLLVVLADQAGILTDQNVRGAPAIVVEIVSPGTRRRDETLKRRLYERAGVREYWIVDPDGETIEVCRPAARKPDRTIVLAATAGHVLTSPLLPGFEVPLRNLFATPRG